MDAAAEKCDAPQATGAVNMVDDTEESELSQEPLACVEPSPAQRAALKPKYRGVSHQIAFFLSLVSGVAMTALAPPGVAALAVAVYVGSVSTLFGASALYHRPNWQPKTRAWLRRLDHSAIYVLIAGTYTPVSLLALPEESGHRLLATAWVGAGLGIAKSLAWVHAPKPLSALLYVVLGWLVVSEGRAVAQGLGPVGLALLGAGGVCYTVGAVIYARRRPDPWPRLFGYHEIFHALVILAALCHMAMIARLVWR